MAEDSLTKKLKWNFSCLRNLLQEIHASRSILGALVRKNIEGRYKNSVLGIGWQFITPLVTIIIFYIVFTGIFERNIDEYWLYLCVGTFPFNFLQSNLGVGSGCIVNNGQMINKMYFPREIIVLAQVLSSFIVFLISVSLVILLMLLTSQYFNLYSMLYLIPLLFLMFMFATGMVFLTASIVVYVKDLQHAIDVFSRMIFWGTPIFYLVSNTRGLISSLVWCNPFTYFVESFHNILYYGIPPDSTWNIVILTMSLGIFITGLCVFSKLKNGFAERV